MCNLRVPILALWVVSASSLDDTIVSIKRMSDDVDIRRLPGMLKAAGYMPDQKIASFLATAEVVTLGFIHAQTVKTSSTTVDSDTLCDFVSMASRKLSLKTHCAADEYGQVEEYDNDLHVNDTDASFQRHLKWMNMGEVWQLALPHVKRDVKVAVIDSGINWDDADFAPLKTKLPKKSGGEIDGGWNLLTQSSDLTTESAHGTKVSKILAAKSNNSAGIAGVAPNVILVPLQIVNSVTAPLSRTLAAMDLAIDLGVDIVSMSFTFNFTTDYRGKFVMFEALRSLHNNGIIYVSSSGNDGVIAENHFPCWYGGPLGICVASIENDRTHNVLTGYSNWGQRVDVAAYGNRILTGRDNDGNLTYFSGTSAAAPIVSGVAAILLSIGVAPLDVKPLIIGYGDPVVSDAGHTLRHRNAALNVLRTVRTALRHIQTH
ncbi:Thermitase, putative [Perkinsus marinus ATCC 50983]|uniref:subtilisin n=1 Tax=Perkinsus marinus (strain ATCC 50983 / TXsc) TaxID=423536 RepID=C5L087_PERM5|nr:Thermitase, putative [Perkinsus marinus ATCC 50983]EER09945.1 Thermitase, putative [Perkinsus marinus ATCC 50983]|eukprot:XP_002778150.1 Thermitase, putative [Perkinsus marinus ATCC 50983]